MKEHEHPLQCYLQLPRYGTAQVSIYPIDEWIKQLWDPYTMEYYWVTKNSKKILPFVTVWMGLEKIMLSEISQSEKDK